jgi:hypothetical protein
VAFAGKVIVDAGSRTLIVKPAEVGSQAAVLWRQAHRELVEDEKFRNFGYNRLVCLRIPPAVVRLPGVCLRSLGVSGSAFRSATLLTRSWLVNRSPRLSLLSVRRGRS